MGFRFQRRIKLLPGLWINASKSGLSLSAKCGPFTANSRGTITAGIKGTGLSYRHDVAAAQRREQHDAVYATRCEIRDELIHDLSHGVYRQDFDNTGCLDLILHSESATSTQKRAARRLQDNDEVIAYLLKPNTPAELLRRLQLIRDYLQAIYSWLNVNGYSNA